MIVPERGLVVSNLSKSYKKRIVLKDVSLSVQQGEAVGLLGPNGAGKTTSFYCVTGLISPDTGKITLNGIDITKFPVYRRARLGIGYLPQEASIFRGLNVEDNIRAVLEVVEKNKEKAFAVSSLSDNSHSRKSSISSGSMLLIFFFPNSPKCLRKH